MTTRRCGEYLPALSRVEFVDFTRYVFSNQPVAVSTLPRLCGSAPHPQTHRPSVPAKHVNIILFQPAEVELPLSRRDPRAVHILGVLHRRVGEAFEAGLIDGPRGKGTLVAIGPESISLKFEWHDLPPPLAPIHLLVGLPRPQTARDILRDATTLGVAALHFFRPEKGEAGYATSRLWHSDEWKECIVSGAAQAFCTRLPEISFDRPLGDVLAGLPAGACCLALDNYEAASPLNQCHVPSSVPVVLAFGSERGWSAKERDILREAGFVLCDLGARVLRTETASVAAITLVKAKLGLL